MRFSEYLRKPDYLALSGKIESELAEQVDDVLLLDREQTCMSLTRGRQEAKGVWLSDSEREFLALGSAGPDHADLASGLLVKVRERHPDFTPTQWGGCKVTATGEWCYNESSTMDGRGVPPVVFDRLKAFAIRLAEDASK